MKKFIFTFIVSLLSVAMFAKDVTISFSGKDAEGITCPLSKVLVENLTQNWTETLSGSSFELVMEEKGQGLENVYASNGSLSVIGTDPFSGNTLLNLNVEQTGDVHVSLIDLSGRVIYNQTQMLNAGSYVLNVSIPMAQMFYLLAETKAGVQSAKIISFAKGSDTEVSISQGAVQRAAVKLNGDKYYSNGDQMRFTGYATIEGVEYTDIQTATMYSGSSKKIVFAFATPVNPKEPDTASLYLGIIGFNDNLMKYQITKMSKSKATESKNFIDRFDINAGTLLYHADWNALDMLQEFNAPKDLSNATLVTFTDGLDLASHQQTSKDLFYYDEDNTRYRDSVHYRIMHDKVADMNVSAYAIGIKGNDVNTPKKIEQFEQNLPLLASDAKNAYQVSDMKAVNQKFDSIAKSLNKVNTKSDLKIVAVSRNSNTRISWTLDLDTAKVKEWNVGVDGVATSKQYISATYWRKNGVSFLTNIKCEGLTCVMKDTVWGDDNYKTTFLFSDIRDLKGDAITSFPLIYEWVREDETENWTTQSEFDRDGNITPIPQNSSAVIMLVLDCSSSLGKDGLAEIKKAAKNFIDVITSELKEDESGDPSGNPDTETTYYIKHSWGSGADKDWSWKQMTKEGSNYVYSGLWGGKGANINTTASDEGADWFDTGSISGASSLTIGDGVKFIYNPSSSALSVVKY